MRLAARSSSRLLLHLWAFALSRSLKSVRAFGVAQLTASTYTETRAPPRLSDPNSMPSISRPRPALPISDVSLHSVQASGSQAQGPQLDACPTMPLLSFNSPSFHIQIHRGANLDDVNRARLTRRPAASPGHTRPHIYRSKLKAKAKASLSKTLFAILSVCPTSHA